MILLTAIQSTLTFRNAISWFPPGETAIRFAQRFEYCEPPKETAVFCVLFNGEELNQVATNLGIRSNYTLAQWVRFCQHKIETGLITLPACYDDITKAGKVIKQRSAELEQALQKANIMILALYSIVAEAEKDGTRPPAWLKLSIREKPCRNGALTKRS